ncbi:hypothetical protein MKC66_03935 [[Clostridium] innocuum]|nr:hypothetical protein [[Clostridium] innocuum]
MKKHSKCKNIQRHYKKIPKSKRNLSEIKTPSEAAIADSVLHTITKNEARGSSCLKIVS